MKMSGAPDPEYVAARRVLLDALEALEGQLDALILVGAQAIYIHTGEADLAVAPYTTDADIAFDPNELRDAPKIDEALSQAGFVRDVQQPGVWLGEDDVNVDLMVPEAVGGRPGKRAAAVGPHGPMTARNARGLEGALVDNERIEISALEPDDPRHFEIAVAGPSALLIAKLHKIWERRDEARRLEDKDALDVVRILRAISSAELEDRWLRIARDERASAVADDARRYIRELFGSIDSLGAAMAARSVELVADPAETAASAAALAADLLDRLERA